ncbi:MAG: phage head morphogenesis protein, partial [Deltaproteobacteria bacterium]|nr:phage head morphogenesis protein [Deltaproteobacteria bacterium]
MIKPQSLPFEAAIKFWKDKLKLSAAEYYSLSEEARTRAFAVSGIAKLTELETIYDSLYRAIEGKITFAGFKKEVATIAANRGFKTYRLDNIFRTNVQSSYMAGRWSQIQKAKKYRPYAMYSAVRDKITRAIHYALHGKVYPVDHPFWDTWFAPNGFKCRCTVKTLSERQVKARGLKVESRDITGDMVQPVSKDGIKLLPVNLLPDPYL